MTGKTLKYIIVDTAKGQRAILFSEDIVHCEVYYYKKVISAGFVSISDNGKIERVWGAATSFKTTLLNKILESRPDIDDIIINKTLKFGPWDYSLSKEDVMGVDGLKKIFGID